MKKYLILTVGGSCEPLVSSIRTIKPNSVYFLCSADTDKSRGSYTVVDAKGKPCENKNVNQTEQQKLNIREQTGDIEYDYEKIIIEHYDDLNECFSVCYELIKKLNSEKDVEIIADYTGGTKSMTAGLAVAACNFPSVKLNFMAGARVDLKNVVPGTQSIRISNPVKPFIEKTLENVNVHLSKYHYISAIDLLEQVLAIPNLDGKIYEDISNLKSKLKAFSLWDIFQHDQAYNLLNVFRKDFVKHILFLENVIKSAEVLLNKTYGSDQKFSGYEVLLDLISNAERRAEQQRYDDAVARMYRSLELFLQIYLLKNYGIDTGNVNLNRTPSAFQERKANCKYKIQIGLREAYELILMFENDPLRNIFQEYDRKIMDALQQRNYSILAHGFKPLDQNNYENVKILFKFLHICLNKIGVKRDFPGFPKSIKELNNEQSN